jgi:ABC-2 type transport system permease protein/sodium transport system permease protein
LFRLSRKELREILRDRRTIITLILMPVLVYPLLSIAFRQFYLAGMGNPDELQVYHLAFATPEEARFFVEEYLRLQEHIVLPGQPPPAPDSKMPKPRLQVFEGRDLEEAVRNGAIDVGVRLKEKPPEIRLDRNLMFDGEFLYREDSSSGKELLEFLERRLQQANAGFLTQRLRVLRVPQRAVPGFMTRVSIKPEGEPASFSLAALVPLILILTTVTGAVYPAIDLTAGERERGTLEVLVAAPIPRLSLLFAKYVAVLTVAMLTALVNLLAMTITVLASGLGPLLFGPSGLSLAVIVQVLALLLLFASFFSAVLLALSSFARSFKEAQAYLVPLMLLALGPGLLGMMPGLKLSGLLVVTPLLNIVLLSRDLFQGTATLAAAVVVIISTGLYALAALGLAARVFGAEAVLYSTQSGWSDLFRRPPSGRSTATTSSALTCLAIMFPAYFLASGLLPQWTQDAPLARLWLLLLMTAAIFAGVPWAAVVWSRLTARDALLLRWPPRLAWPAAILLGLSLWPFAHELVVAAREVGIRTLSEDQLARARELVVQWRSLPPALLMAALAIVPAVCEELFFRGYLFNALRSRTGPIMTILGTALIFGLFHFVTVDGLTLERLVPSTLMGLVLGWVCWRTGSVFPGMLLHGCHNGLLVILALYGEQFLGTSGAEAEQNHLPLAWLAMAGGGAAAGFVFMLLGSRRGGRQ